MKKQAVNTFNKGLVMDFHPLLTPNNVLTNNLNGALITFNGNEYVLQNDLGNGEVGTAKLPSGYVPVGMKEHGGIIYVASHNPITGKSQIGSFPSPQQLYNGEEDNIESISINFNQMVAIDSNYSVPIIKYETVKSELFRNTDSSTVSYRVFHPGDKFIITTDSFTNSNNSPLLQAIADGIVTIDLGIVTSSGSIEYINEKDLRIYDNVITAPNGKTFKSWIYNKGTSETIASILSKQANVQVFRGKSSGYLILIINLNTINSFNLIRTYSQDKDGIKVKFNGLMVSDIADYNGRTYAKDKSGNIIENNYIKLFDPTNVASSPYVDSLITLVEPTSTNKLKSYEISPACPYGVLTRMKKSGVIDFSEIRPNSEKFSEWRFFVNTESGYIRISWGYDYYNMTEEEAVSKMEFLFYDLETTPQSDFLTATTDEQDAALNNISYRYEVTRDYYNGNFEEIIPFGNSTILANKIYVVVIRKKVSGVWSNVVYRLVYTGTFYNSLYEELSDYTQLASTKSSLREVSINSTSSVTSSSTKDSTLYKSHLGTVDDTNYSSTISPGSLIQKTEQDTNVDNYYYSTKVKRNYNIKVNLAVSNNWNTASDISNSSYYKYVGDIDSNAIESYYKNPTVETSEFDYSKLSTSSDDDLADIIKDTSRIESTLGTITFDGLTGTGSASTTREIYAKNGGVNEYSTYLEKLLPLYTSDMSKTDKEDLYNFTTSDDIIYCVTGAGGSHNSGNILYNSKIVPGDLICEGSAVQGTNTNAGGDDEALQAAMAATGHGIVGIMGGHGTDAAFNLSDFLGRPLYPQRVSTGSVSSPWTEGNTVLSGDANFLICTWKTEYKQHVLINFASRKDDSLKVVDSSTNFILRMDKMLNCILSQILTIHNTQTLLYFVGPSNENYTYHTPFNTICKLTLTNKTSDTKIDNVEVFYNKNKQTISSLLNGWKAVCTTLDDILPKVSVTVKSKNTVNVEFGSDIKLNDSKTNIVDYYISAYSREAPYDILPTSVTAIKDFRKKIFVADPFTCTGHNKDGSLTYSTDAFGNYTPFMNNGTILDGSLALWDHTVSNPKIEALQHNLNDMFITSYDLDGRTGVLPKDSYFNGIYLRKEFAPLSSDIINYQKNFNDGHWNDGGNSAPGPDMCVTATFWDTAITVNGVTYYRRPYKVLKKTS